MKKKLLLLLLPILVIVFSTKAQNALNFDGTDDFVQTNISGVLSSGDRTFEAWVYVSINAPSSNLTILDYGANIAGARNTFLVDGTRGLRFVSGGTNANLSSATTGVVPVGQWTHVAFVLDSGTGYLYVNGSQVGTGNLSNVNTPGGNTNVKIGQRVSGGTIPFSGAIDEVRVWSVARAPSEIMANMNSELCSYPNSLVAYYKFNQGVSQGNNIGLTNVIGELGDTAIATNFAMMGAISNWETGSGIGLRVPFDFGISIDSTTQLISSNDTSANIHYQWYDCIADSVMVGDTNRTYSTRSGGTYAVILSNGFCSDTSACLTVSFSGGGNVPGEALYFDGVDDYVQTSFPGVLDTNSRTFEAWVYVDPNAPLSNLSILDYGTNAAGSRNTFAVDGNRGIRFISGGTNANINSSGGVVPVSQWTHVAFVLDNGTGYLYVDGNQVAVGNLSNVVTPGGNTDLRIGQRVSGGSIPFSGAIDEVRIWDVARSQAEIIANMNASFCGSIPGLVAHYQMNEGISGGNNSAILSIPNAAKTGDGILSNFALTGLNSNFYAPGAVIAPLAIDTTINQSGPILTANEVSADSYQWVDCSTNMALLNDTLMSYTAVANGNYAVVLTKNGCSDTSQCVNVIGVGINELNFSKNFSLSQNPVNNNFHLNNKNGIKVNVFVRSITGQLIDKKLQINSARIEFDMSNSKTGIYILTIEGDEGLTENYKIVRK